MGDLVADFKSFIQQYEMSTSSGLARALLDLMKPEQAKRFRLCAIPHQFNATVLAWMDPSLEDEQAGEICLNFSHQSSVKTYGPRSYVGATEQVADQIETRGELFFSISEDLRKQLFEEWLQADHRNEFQQVSKRLVEYFSSTSDSGESAKADTRQNNRVFHLLGADQETGFNEFETLLGERRKRSTPGEVDLLVKLVHEYDLVLTERQKANLAYQEAKLAVDRLQYEKGRKLFEQVLSVSELNPELEIKTVVRLGLLESENRRWSTAIDRFEQGLKLLTKIPDATLARTLTYQIKLNLGVTYREMGVIPEAKRYMFESIHEARRLKNDLGMAMAYNSLGTLYRKIGESRTAIKAYLKSQSLLEGADELYRTAQVSNNLGLAYIDHQEWRKGEEALENSLKIKSKLGDTIGLGRTYNNLMQLYRIQRQETKAAAVAEKAIQCFEEVGDYYDMAVATRNLGRLYRSLKKKKEAQEQFEKALKGFQDAHASSEVLALTEEINMLASPRDRKMPWWAWALYTAPLLAFLTLVILLVIGIMASSDGTIRLK